MSKIDIEKIYPWVKVNLNAEQDNSIETKTVLVKGEEINADLIERKLIGNLILLYVYDNGTLFEILQEKDMPEKYSENDLFEKACDNLLRDVEFTMHETSYGGYGLVAGGDHEAASLCIPEIWHEINKHFEGNLLISVPAKDMVLFIEENDEEKLLKMKELALEIYKDGERPLTNQIYLYDKEHRKMSVTSDKI